jgi:hypothetical protein
MKRQDLGLEPELEAFLEHAKVERHVPPEIRARVLARGRAIVAAGGRIPTPALSTAQAPATRTAAPGRAPLRIALAASIAIVGAAVAAAAVLHGRTAHPPPMPLPENRSEAPSGFGPSVASPPESPPPPAEHVPQAHSPRPARTATKGDALTAELDLLQRAQAAYTQRDFLAALVLAAEHARRFSNGHLAEQREALRVRSLLGCGRSDEARRAAAAFAVRFPRSVLLPRVAEGPESSK